LERNAIGALLSVPVEFVVPVQSAVAGSSSACSRGSGVAASVQARVNHPLPKLSRSFLLAFPEAFASLANRMIGAVGAWQAGLAPRGAGGRPSARQGTR
jgi:hypothetical protein